MWSDLKGNTPRELSGHWCGVETIKPWMHIAGRLQKVSFMAAVAVTHSKHVCTLTFNYNNLFSTRSHAPHLCLLFLPCVLLSSLTALLTTACGVSMLNTNNNAYSALDFILTTDYKCIYLVIYRKISWLAADWQLISASTSRTCKGKSWRD